MITQTVHRDIKQIAGLIQIHSETTYQMGDNVRDITNINIVDPLNVLSTDTQQSNRQKMLQVLTTDIYNQYYNAEIAIVTGYPEGNFIMDLSRSNTGTGTWEEGWSLLGTDAKNGKAVVEKENLKFWIDHKKVMPVKSAEGMACLVHVDKERRFLNPYFYYAFGNTPKHEVKNHCGQLLRLYWNLTPKGAVRYMNRLTGLLNANGIVFTTKVLSDPDRYQRVDSGVLYIDKSQLEEVLPLLKTVYDSVKADIRPSVPKFTRQLLPGLGFAEDPQNGLSFGISRAAIIAEALYNGFLNGKNSPSQREEILCDAFEQQGISAENPYATLKNYDDYERILKEFSL